jgi:hypothetical protein
VVGTDGAAIARGAAITYKLVSYLSNYALPFIIFLKSLGNISTPLYYDAITDSEARKDGAFFAFKGLNLAGMQDKIHFRGSSPLTLFGAYENSLS